MISLLGISLLGRAFGRRLAWTSVAAAFIVAASSALASVAVAAVAVVVVSFVVVAAAAPVATTAVAAAAAPARSESTGGTGFDVLCWCCEDRGEEEDGQGGQVEESTRGNHLSCCLWGCDWWMLVNADVRVELLARSLAGTDTIFVLL